MNYFQKKYYALFICLFLGFLIVPVASLEWPVSNLLPSRLFGQKNDTIFERGIILDSVDLVRAAAHGRMLIQLDKESPMTGFPSTLGTAILIAHDDNLTTVYGNLESLERIQHSKTVESQSILSTAGSSSWGKKGSLIFQVLDQNSKTILNPLLVLPPLADNQKPRLKNIIAVSSNGQHTELGQANKLRQGKYSLYAEISDTVSASSTELPPFRISVLLNGSESYVLPFEILQKEGATLYLSKPEAVFTRIYANENGLFLGEISLTRGKVIISTIIRDISGNERILQFPVTVE